MLHTDLLAAPPFSFLYDGTPVRECLPTWQAQRETHDAGDGRVEQVTIFTDAASGLEITWTAALYADYPVIEWTTGLRHTGAMDTPLIESLQGIDVELALGRGDATVHYNRGSHGSAEKDDFCPLMSTVTDETPLTLGVSGGRPSEDYLPYVNVTGDEAGAIVAIGWPGQWRADFSRPAAGGLRVVAGQERTRYRLRPGESARAPLIAVLAHDGDRVAAHNLWRRWMLAHNTPRPNGNALGPRFGALTFLRFDGLSTTEDEAKAMDRYRDAGIRPDVWWIDAGWYECERWPQTGTWDVSRKRHTDGLRSVFDRAHAEGMRTLLWFEPERVAPGTWLAEQRPEWLLGDPAGDRMLDLGNPEAREWLVERVTTLMEENGVDDYRQDFNVGSIEPTPAVEYWRTADADGREGLTENHYVTGYLSFLDELLARRPGTLIDTCASGGRRLDLETLRRAVPLWRSDYRSEPVGTQCQTFGLSPWIPYTGVCGEQVDAYTFRSNMTLAIAGGYDVLAGTLDLTLLRSLLEQWRTIAPCYLGDFYALTPYSLGDDEWLAWQFDCPRQGTGIVQAFRRPACGQTLRLTLQGLEPDAEYAITDLDTGSTEFRTGRALRRGSIAVTVSAAPGAALLAYTRA